MPEPRPCHVPTNRVLVCIRFEHPSQAEALQRYGASTVISAMTRLGVDDD